MYDEPKKGFKIKGTTLTISLGMGQDRKRRSISLSLSEAHRLKDKKIRTLRITSECGKYYAIFTVQKKLPLRKPISKIVALDPNHKNLAYGVDTHAKAIEIATPSWLKIYDKRIDQLKSKRDRCIKKSRNLPVEKGGKECVIPSRRWIKYNQSLEQALHKRREQTKTFMFTLAHSLCKEYDCIAIGNYTPHGGGITVQMRRAMNNRSLIGRFKSIVSWVAKKSGKTYIEYDEKGTTRMCSCCHQSVREGIDPSRRLWQCQHCKAIHHRDENAAINGLRKVLRDMTKNSETIVSQVPGSGLALIQERWAWCVLPSGVLSTPRGTRLRDFRNTKKLKRMRDSIRPNVDHLIV